MNFGHNRNTTIDLKGMENIKVEPDINLFEENYMENNEIDNDNRWLIDDGECDPNESEYDNDPEVIVLDDDDDDDDDDDNNDNIDELDNIDDSFGGSYTNNQQKYFQEIRKSNELCGLQSISSGQTKKSSGRIENVSNDVYANNYDDYNDDYDDGENEDDENFISYEELKRQYELEMREQNKSNITFNDESCQENNNSNDNEYNDFDSNFICKICFKQVANRYNLKRHMMIHTGERPYGCDMCTKRFREFCDLKKHRRIHCTETGYICMVCYENPPSLNDSTKCLFCLEQENVQKQFATGGTFVEYPSTHENGRKQYTCPLCHRIFGSSHNLKRHTMIHTGEKPYKCDDCNRSFREMSTLKKHQLTVHSNQQSLCNGNNGAGISNVKTDPTLYKCELCQKKFLSSNNLSEHVQFYHSELIVNIVSNEIHPCNVCGRNFRTNQHLQSHMITHS